MRKMLNIRNVSNAFLLLLLLTLIFVPSAKAMLLQGLMQVGFFKADTSVAADHLNVNATGVKFRDANGKVVDLGDLRGKVVFLNFWATWCPPCIAEMPAINKLHQRFEKDSSVVFLLVDADSNLEKARQFMIRKKLNLPVHVVASDIPEILFKGQLPTTVVFDKQGKIAYNESGAANYGHPKFIEFINNLKNAN